MLHFLQLEDEESRISTRVVQAHIVRRFEEAKCNSRYGPTLDNLLLQLDHPKELRTAWNKHASKLFGQHLTQQYGADHTFTTKEASEAFMVHLITLRARYRKETGQIDPSDPEFTLQQVSRATINRRREVGSHFYLVTIPLRT